MAHYALRLAARAWVQEICIFKRAIAYTPALFAPGFKRLIATMRDATGRQLYDKVNPAKREDRQRFYTGLMVTFVGIKMWDPENTYRFSPPPLILLSYASFYPDHRPSGDRGFRSKSVPFP
jgi:hypothetical protein